MRRAAASRIWSRVAAPFRLFVAVIIPDAPTVVIDVPTSRYRLLQPPPSLSIDRRFIPFLPSSYDNTRRGFSLYPLRGKGDQLQEIRGQVEQLGAAGFPAKQGLHALAERRVRELADHGRDLPLGLRADALIWQPRGDRIRGHDGSGVEVYLVVEIEAVDVVVHGMKQVEPTSGQH